MNVEEFVNRMDEAEKVLTVSYTHLLVDTCAITEAGVCMPGGVGRISGELPGKLRFTLAVLVIRTVSYTHLDVYKRQLLDNACAAAEQHAAELTSFPDQMIFVIDHIIEALRADTHFARLGRHPLRDVRRG